MSDLEPCPMCEGAALIGSEVAMSQWFWCECPACGLKSRSYRSRALALDAWNRRAPSADAEAKALRENLRELWNALRMIREGVETLAPVGAVPNGEYLLPEPHHEAAAILAGIQKMADDRAPSAEDTRLRAEVASLRAALGQQPAAEGTEPVGCPIPGMCAAVAAHAAAYCALPLPEAPEEPK